ncbi:hypothetical protein, partial [Serratia ureilytica]|uniref:hypothetical protein n=1 Tax=Serratia ureilytica TaxID=300181 RepID=UPI00254EA572
LAAAGGSDATGGQTDLDHRLSLSLQGDDLGDALPRWRQRIELQTGWTLAPARQRVAQIIALEA